MSQIKNTEIVGNLLTTIINISGRKTTLGHAVIKIETVIQQLKDKYDFLRHVEIKDTRFIEGEKPVNVLSDVNSVSPILMGEALTEIITTMHKSLGRDAGHFFIKEIQNNLDEDHSSTMREMGIDLGLMQLEHEVAELERQVTTKKEE